MNAETAVMGDVPRWAVMWLMAGAVFLAGKVAMLRGAGLEGWRRALAWMGMDPGPFRECEHRRTRIGNDWIWPAANALMGATLLWGVARHFERPLAAGWVGMVGLILVLHFGTFGLLAMAWRALGVPVIPIMRAPVAATSLAEFWGRRWNLAFRDVSHHVIFTPVARRAGHRAAMWVTFAVSGLIHDAVISLPAGAGFGLPTAYFLLQALGVSLERKVDRTVRAPLVRWLRTHAFTVLPAFVLFHPPFVERVMVPFFHVIGALP